MSPAAKKSKRAGFVGSVTDPVTRLAARIARVVLGTLLAVAVVGSLTAAAYFTWRHGGPRLRQREEFRVAVEEIEVTPAPPPWVGPKLHAEVKRLAGLPDVLYLLEPDVLEETAQAFSLHPWVAEVVRASKSYPGTLRLELRYRAPVAMIEVIDGLYPVDVDGVLLPSSAFSAAEAKRYPRVVGIRTRPAGTAGTPWGDPQVTGAARIAAALDEHWEALNLDALEVARSSAAGKAETDVFFLLSKGGTRVAWGRPPDSDRPGEVSVDEKIARLTRYVAEHGSLEAPDGPYELDLRHWQDISLRPRTRS
jgi:hypothetical protein